MKTPALHRLRSSKSKDETGSLSTLQHEGTFRRHEWLPLFTTPDLFSEFCPISVAEHCKEMTTLTCQFCAFRFEVMPLGLMNAPALFLRMMNKVPTDIAFARVYLDDMVMLSKGVPGDTERAITLLERLSCGGLRLNLGKCRFSCEKAKLLGYIVSKERASVDSDKIRAIADTATP